VISSKIKNRPQPQLQLQHQGIFGLHNPIAATSAAIPRITNSKFAKTSQLQSQVPFKPPHGLPTATQLPCAASIILAWQTQYWITIPPITKS